jgi:hypothetical protein
MANRAYLKCLHGRSTREVVATYSLPDVWLDFFGPADFHTGNACPVDGACTPNTSSYLLADASVALARFAERMRRAGIPLTGDGMTARVHAWWATHFAEGWLFADITELEWMTPTFVPATRKALAEAERRVERRELSPDSLLLDLGWGTGLSSDEVEVARERALFEPSDGPIPEARPYRMQDTYAVGDRVEHPVFGAGFVGAVTHTTVTVAFPCGARRLAHRKA